MKLPGNLPINPDQKKNREEREAINALLDWARGLAIPSHSVPLPPTKPAEWSNTAPPPEIEVGEVREVSDTICDVWDGSGFARMTKMYYEEHYKGKVVPHEPQAEIEA